ncbi:hypothetical protein CYG49_01530 [Candidatus Saccharibacteria bacterium]|nr:MAG: hypothetical protein CYG49_01530 [Candidatus Saccharibacteria bacterium]
MDKKTLLTGIISFIVGGLVVSTAVVASKGSNQNHSGETSMSMDAMTDELRGKTGDEFDKAFISTMIEHHQGAIEMAEMADKQAKHQEIKQLSGEIITAQEAEIAQMKEWQKQWGYEQKSGTGH